MVNLKLVGVVAMVFLCCVIADEKNGKNVKPPSQNVTEEQKNKFGNWKQKCNKTYSSSKEVEKARDNYIKTAAKVEAHNKLKNETYKQGTNSHSDMTYEERKAKRTGIKKKVGSRLGTGKGTSSATEMMASHVIKNVTVPNFVNYTRFFPAIKDQKDCGGCWAFAANAVLEYWSVRSRTYQSYSEQNLIDCVTTDSGCDAFVSDPCTDRDRSLNNEQIGDRSWTGGWPTDAYNYVRDQGVSDGTKYTFKRVTQTCQRNATQYPPILKIPNACEIDLNGNEEDLKKIVAQYGPVAGAMSITEGFTNYKSGIFSDKTCSTYWLDHAVTIVGYGTDKDAGDYWIIRNSWGTTWGMNGYGLLARNHNNSCAIGLYAMFPC